MKIKILRIAQSAVFFAVIGMQTSNVHTTTFNSDIIFFKDTDTVMISSRTADLVNHLESVVLQMRMGDRPVKRYFQSYSTPFYESGARTTDSLNPKRPY